jgi:hypothetical protein
VRNWDEPELTRPNKPFEPTAGVRRRDQPVRLCAPASSSTAER